MTFRGEGRHAIVLLMLCLLLAAQSAAFISINEQHHSQDHCCLLCHVGPLPFLQAPVSAVLEPAFSIVWLESPHDPAATHDAQQSIRSSRAPPV